METPPKKVEQMTELEFEQHIQECREIADRNNWEHILEKNPQNLIHITTMNTEKAKNELSVVNQYLTNALLAIEIAIHNTPSNKKQFHALSYMHDAIKDCLKYGMNTYNQFDENK